jgi:hypothetical protein
VSGFTGRRRENPDRHVLAAFLELVKAGRVPRGSYLVVESLDWLSREHIRLALSLPLNLIEPGVSVVQLLPAEAVFDKDVEPMALMMAVMEMSRGHSESRMKGERVGAVWREKKRNAPTSGPSRRRSRVGPAQRAGAPLQAPRGGPARHPPAGEGADKVLTLAGMLADIEDRIGKLKAALGSGEVESVDVLREPEAEKTATTEELARAQAPASRRCSPDCHCSRRAGSANSSRTGGQPGVGAVA